MAAPTILITQAIGLTNFHLLDTTTGVSGFRHSGGGTPTPQNETDIFVQGTQAVSIKASGTTRDEGLYATTLSAVDLTTDANKHVYVWAAITTVSQHDTIANGGVYIIVGSSATDWVKFFVNGSDTIDGRFVRYVMDVTKKPSEVGGTVDLTNIDRIGIGVKGTITAKSENVILDRVDYGTGLAIEDGQASNPANWLRLFEADDNISNKYGIVEKRSGVYFLKGGLRIGDASGTKTSLWRDISNSTVVFEDPQYHNGDALVSSITAEDLYRIELVGNATGTTDIDFGEVIGTGDARQGVNGGAIRSDGPKWDFDAETDIADLDSVNFLGVQAQGAGSMLFGDVAKTVVAGSSFTNCGLIEPHLADWLNNTLIAPLPDLGLAFLTSSNVKQTKFVFSSGNFNANADRVWQVDVSVTPDAFVDETADFNSGAANDIDFFPATEAVGDYCAFGSVQKFGRLRINVGTAGVAGVVAWEYWDGSAWAALKDVEDNTSNLTSTGNGDVDFRLPHNWEPLSINGESPLMYVRARVTTVYTTNPLGTSGSFRKIAEHMVIHSITTGPFTYDDLTFFGSGLNKFDIGNISAAVLASSYPITNQDSTQNLGDGTTDGVAQSFLNGTTFQATGLRIQISKTLSPTGTVLAKVYAHSGTFGTSSIPTGAALATSNPVDLVDITTFLTYRLFEFEDQITLDAATHYVVSIEYAGGDASNHLNVGYDGSSPTHAGNKATLASAVWSAQAGDDVTHEFYTSSATLAIMQISATNGSDPATDDNMAENAGATIISNPTTYTLVGLENGSELRIFTDTSPPVELAGIESVTGGQFIYNHNGDVVAIYVIIQKLDFEWLRRDDTLGASDEVITIRQIPDDNYENP